jgi:hypothetical protein
LLKRANAHANGVNYLLQLLQYNENFADFRMTRIKSGRSVLCPIYIAMLPYAVFLELLKIHIDDNPSVLTELA